MDLNKLVGKNQSIKIVPSLKESLRSKGLNVDLDYNTELWFNQLKTTWKTWKNNATIENHIQAFFTAVPDPYRIALVFSIHSDESKDCKPKSLPFFVIETLKKWSEKNGVLPDNSLKLPAFHIATQQRNCHFQSLVLKTYYVHTVKEMILPLVKGMVKDENCRQACHIVVALELFKDIPVEELLFPLILQDKINVLDDYLVGCPNQVKPLLLFLDSLLDRNHSLNDYVQRYIDENNISQVKHTRLNDKALGKLVGRLCNKFNIPIESCKNLSKSRTTRGLRYLIYQKYHERNISSCVWEDLVKDSLKVNEGSAKEFINVLVDYDKKEALKWAEYLKMSETDLPLALKDMSLQDNEKEENWETESTLQEYYKLSLSDNQIITIDTIEKCYDLLKVHLSNTTVIGIDCEWKPSFGATQSQVALIQIATVNNVYLIDCLEINKPQYASFWYTFQKKILDDGEIIKIGFGIEQDFKEMKASIPGLNNIKVKGGGLLDLAILWKALLDNGLNLPSNSDSGGNSLNSLVQSCFGLPLEKSEQCSNWELRPLRSTQIKYAALDAYVLIEIYYYLQNKCDQLAINFEEICNNLMLEGKKKSSKKVEKHQPVETNQGIVNMKPIAEIKLLLDSELSSIIPYLRYCGLDTIMTPPTMMWHDVINLAISEDRYLLLTKLKCSPTANYPQSNILDIGKGSVKDQIQKIFTGFDIKVTQDNLLTRCMDCNGANLKKINAEDVSDICNKYQSVTTENNLTTDYSRDGNYEDDEYNNFLSDSDGDECLYKPVQSQKRDCKTSTGADVIISNVQKLAAFPQPAILCETCGTLHWEGDNKLKRVSELLFTIKNIHYLLT